jgi:DNA-binding LytR/AlgR family response regulator
MEHFMIINIAICDDKQTEIENLFKQIDIVFSKYISATNKIGIYKYTDPNKLIEDYKIKKYDLIFLDIEMPLMDGFSVAEILTTISSSVKIVFVTSHDDLVYDSFKYTPIEFIRKNHLSYDMERKGKYIFSKIQQAKANYIFIHNNINIDLKLTDIIYIENIRNDIKIYTNGDNVYMLKRKTLKNFISELQYSNIIQIHMSYAVNVEFIYSPPKYDNVKLIKDITLPIGRKFKNDLNEKFMEYAKGFMI